ncbi:MAG: tRNA pseudouridine(13) synthase TruD [archaeon]
MTQFITITPALKGKVKQRYSDFIVEEVLLDGKICRVERYDRAFEQRDKQTMYIPKEKKEHLLLDLEKINIDTVSAVAQISRGLNVSKTRIGYAGLKDKRGITCQRISIFDPDPARVEKFGMRGIEIRHPEWSDKRIELGELKGNNFVIIIRDISETEEETRRIIEAFSKQAEKGLPNFFGNQRFGGIRQITHRVGKVLLKEDYKEAVMLYLTDTYYSEKEDIKNARINFAKTLDVKKALKEFPIDARQERAMLNHLLRNPNDFAGAIGVLPKKMRYLFVHSYQSFLFNKMLEERIKEFGTGAIEAIDGDVLENGLPSGLLAGYESKFAEGKAGEIERRVLEGEKTKFEDFKVAGMSELSSQGSRKSFVLKTENFKLLEIDKDEFNEGKLKAKISFFLSKGNYATTVLRELLKEDIM